MGRGLFRVLVNHLPCEDLSWRRREGDLFRRIGLWHEVASDRCGWVLYASFCGRLPGTRPADVEMPAGEPVVNHLHVSPHAGIHAVKRETTLVIGGRRLRPNR